MLDFIKYKGFKLPMIYEEDKSLPIVYVKLLFKNSGRAYDDVAGLSSMFARLLNEGCDDNFFKELELRAINLSASSDFESFELSISCLKENLDFALKALKNLLYKPRFDEKLLNLLKLTALGELSSRNSDYDYLAKRLLDKTVYPYDEFSSSNDGDELSIQKISLKELQDFHKKNLCLENLILSFGGDIKKEQFKDSICVVLDELNTASSIKEKSFAFVDSRDVFESKKQSKQAYIYFATPFELDFTDKSYHLAKIALFVLGAGGFGSRIMEEVRVKRGLAYSAYARLDCHRTYKRVFGYLQTKNENAALAKDLIKEILATFIKDGISEYELTQAKNFLLGSSCLHYESLAKRLDVALSEFYKGLKIGHLKEELKLIEKTNLKDLNSFLKEQEKLSKVVFASVLNAN